MFIIDDVDRIGKQELAEEVKLVLIAMNVSYFCNIFTEIKKQLVISSCALYF